MDNEVIISLIIPTYNSSKHLGRLLASLDKQICSDEYEVIFVDASEDDTISMLTSFSNSHKNINVLKTNKRGVDAQRNYGIENANGLYICFVDSDDEIGNHFIINALDIIKNNNADLFLFDFEWYRDGVLNNQIMFGNGLYTLDKETIYHLLYSSNYSMVLSSPWSKIYKRSLIGNIRFAGSRFEDTVFNFNYLMYVNKIYFSNYIAYHYFSETGSNSLSKISINSSVLYIKYHIKQYRVLRRTHNISSYYALYNGFNRFLISIVNKEFSLWDIITIKCNMLFSTLFDYRVKVLKIHIFTYFPLLLSFFYKKMNKFDKIVK